MVSTKSLDSHKIPRRDYIILPLLSLFTVFILLGTAEIIARIGWEQERTDVCQIDDPRVGMLFKPNCTARIKAAEGPWVINQYNECGYRTKESCRVGPSNHLRVAVIGMSVSRGYEVPYDLSFAARASKELEHICSEAVDFQNLGGGGGGKALQNIYLRAAEAASLKPNAILMVITPFDIQQLEHGAGAAHHTRESGSHISLQAKLKERAASFVKEARERSRAFFLAEHLLYLNLSAYLPVYLKHDDEADYLRPPFKLAWQERFALLDQSLSKVASEAKAANVPVLLVFVPQRAQAALVTWDSRPSDVDPEALGNEIGLMASKYEMHYLDLTEEMSRESDLSNIFYAVDSHPTAQGHEIIARSVVSKLISAIPAFGSCHTGQRLGQEEAVH